MKLRVELLAEDGSIHVGEIDLKKSVQKAERRKVVTCEPKRVTARTALELLWQRGKFKHPLSFSAVKAALVSEEHSFPDSTLMMALASAREFLTRRGSKGNYTWSQKYPYRE